MTVQNGFIFGTNPAGVEYDGQVTNEGQGSGRFGGGGSGRPSNNRQQRGSGGGFNLNWDGAWRVVTRVTDVGWTAEIAIPFRTLRYPRSEVQTWGMNFQRNIRVRNEQAYWSPLPRQYNLNRISLAGELQSLMVPPQRNLQLTPYAVGEALHRTESATTVATREVGADLKYSVTPSMTLDLTYNTDFAQVEVDDEQINLDRFTLFFPEEKRPFFLENAGLFSVGQAGAVDIFFSRRIGLGDDLEQIPLIGGGRLSGKVGTNTNIGVLNMQTQSVDGTGTPMQNFTVARVRQDLPNRSNVGAMFVNRQASGSLAGDQDYNRSYAFDGNWGIGEGGTISGFVAETDTPDAPAGASHAYAVNAQHRSERARLRLGYTEVAPNFNPEVGFLARESYRQISGSVFTTFRPENFMSVLELRPHVNHNTYVDYESGLYETQFTHIDNHIEWRNGYEVHTGMNITKEGVFEAFDIFPGVMVPPGTYDHKEAQIAGNTNLGAPVSASVNTIVGGLFGGDRVTIAPSISARIGETVNATFEWSYNDLRLPGGDFTTNLAARAPLVLFYDPDVLSGSRSVQRPRRPVVVQSPFRLALRCQHRALRRLQRRPGAGKRDSVWRRTYPDPQIQPSLQSLAVRMPMAWRTCAAWRTFCASGGATSRLGIKWRRPALTLQTHGTSPTHVHGPIRETADRRRERGSLSHRP